MKILPRTLVVLCMLATTLVADVGGAREVRVPRTLVDRAPVDARAVEPAFPIDYVGVTFDLPSGHAHDDDAHGAVRFLRDGAWGPWRPLIEDGAQASGEWGSALIAADDADAYQIRGLPEEARRPRAVAINTTDGRPVTVGSVRSGSAAAIPNCLSRADWGADESLRFDDEGNEVWPPEFFDAQVMTVHHTATQNDDPDPAATVRAIYRYHAVDRGWGDIGYQYLIDEQGRTYEGRWSGSASSSCVTEGGDGRDFAHETTADEARMVTAAHTGGYNSGNLGVALLGEFTTHPVTGGEPKPTAVDALEGVLAELSTRHGIDPEAVVTYRNPHPSSDATKTVHTISGHRDWVATECPGENLYEDLPEIRSRVADRMEGSGDGGTEPETIHVGDLDGRARDTSGPTWTAVVVVRILDDQGDPVPDVVVEGTWSRGGGASCTTGDTGRCRVRERDIPKRVKQIGFTVDDVRGPLPYDPDANTDPDGDSDGTSITVRRT